MCFFFYCNLVMTAFETNELVHDTLGKSVFLNANINNH